jgi:hypothetical protein
MYTCELCNYSTNKIFNYKKHLHTEKHLKMDVCDKILKESKLTSFICNYCKKKYKSAIYFTKHESKCKLLHSTDINLIKYNNEHKLKMEKLKSKYKILQLELLWNKTPQTPKKNKKNDRINSYQIGMEYEKYVFETIKNNYKSCYRWNDIPINILSSKFYNNYKICDDIGCDIIGINHDNTIDYIQCKNYSSNNTIKIADLAGFYNFVSENLIENSIVYYSGKLSRQVILRKYNVQYRNLQKNKTSFTIEN